MVAPESEAPVRIGEGDIVKLVGGADRWLLRESDGWVSGEGSGESAVARPQRWIGGGERMQGGRS